MSKFIRKRLAGGDDVAAVAEAFAVRTVRLHADDVGEERAAAHFLNPVEPLVRAREGARVRQVGVERNAAAGGRLRAVRAGR